jgi:hypothetical protein
MRNRRCGGQPPPAVRRAQLDTGGEAGSLKRDSSDSSPAASLFPATQLKSIVHNLVDNFAAAQETW